MVSIETFVDTSTDPPSLRVGRFVSTLFGTIILGYLSGAIDFVVSISGGIQSAIVGFGDWISGELLPSILGILPNVIRAAWESNIEFVTETFGAFAVVIVALEISIILLIMMRAIRSVI